MKRALASKHLESQRRYQEGFVQWCDDHGYSSSDYSYDTVGGYTMSYVDRLDGSTKTVDALLSALRAHCVTTGHSFLDRADARLIYLLIKELKYADTHKIRRVCPLTKELLRRIFAKCGKDFTNLRTRMGFTLVSLGHDALLRCGELSGLKVKDVRWSKHNTRANIDLYRTKRCRSGNGESVLIQDYGYDSGCNLLSEWFTIMDIWDQPDAYVFPQFDDRSKKFCFEAFTTTDKMRKIIKEFVTTIGLLPSQFSGHSMRAGGATDLFRQGVPYATVKKFGRWKSDAALLYFRDEREASNMVMEAFARILRKY